MKKMDQWGRLNSLLAGVIFAIMLSMFMFRLNAFGQSNPNPTGNPIAVTNPKQGATPGQAPQGSPIPLLVAFASPPAGPSATPTVNLTVQTSTPTGSPTPTNTPTGTGTATPTATSPASIVNVINEPNSNAYGDYSAFPATTTPSWGPDSETSNAAPSLTPTVGHEAVDDSRMVDKMATPNQDLSQRQTTTQTPINALVTNPATPDTTKLASGSVQATMQADQKAIATTEAQPFSVSNPPTPNQTMVAGKDIQLTAVVPVAALNTPGTAPNSSQLVAGEYKSTSPTLTDGQGAPLPLTSGDNVKVTLFTNNSSFNGMAGIANANDANSNTSINALAVQNYGVAYNGSTWDRIRTAIGTTGIQASNLVGTLKTYSATFNQNTNATDSWEYYNPNASGETILISCIWMSGYATTPALGAVTVTRRLTPDFYAGATVTPTPLTFSKANTSDAAAGGAFIDFVAGPTPGTADSDVFVSYIYYDSTNLLTVSDPPGMYLVWPPPNMGSGNKLITLLPGQALVLKTSNPTGGSIVGTVQGLEYP